MDNSFNFIALYLFSSLFAVLIIAYIFKLVFNMSKQLKHSEAQTLLLKEIAQKYDVEQHKIDAIVKMTEL